MLNFQCNFCETDIQSDYAYIGEFVQCPICSTYLIVPDPILPYKSDFQGYTIEKMRASTLLWNTYEVSAIDGEGNTFLSLMRVPGAFFLKRVSNFDEFSNVVIKSGAMNVSGIPHLKDYSLVPGKVYFLFEHFLSHDLESFIIKNGPIDPFNALRLVKNTAEALSQVWNKNKTIHQNLVPRNIRINNKLESRIMNIGISQYLLQDQTLLEQGFNIWDARYMSPEFTLKGKGDSPSCDIYALGSILYFTITGKHPYLNIQSTDIPQAPIPEMTSDIPDSIISLIQLMMAKQTTIRLNSWEEVIERIDTIYTKSKPISKKSNFTDKYAKYSSPVPLKPVGLSHMRKGAITEKVRIKKQVASKKNKMTDTVAKLATPELKNIHTTWVRQKRQERKSGGLKNYVGLIVVLVLALLVAFPILFFLIKNKNKNLKTVENNSSNQSNTDNSVDNDTNIKPDPGPVGTAQPRPVGIVKPDPVGTIKTNPVGTVKPDPVGTIKTDPNNTEKTKDAYELELASINEFCQKNPDKIEEAIEKYDGFYEKAFYANRMDIVNLIKIQLTPLESKLKKNTNEKVNIVMAELKKNIVPMIANKEYDKAIKLLQGYEGELAKETLFERTRYARKIKDHLNDKKIFDEKNESFLSEFAEKLAPGLLNRQFMQIEIQLKLAANDKDSKLSDAILKEWTKQINDYESLSKKYSASDNAKEIITIEKQLDKAYLVKGLIFYEKGKYDESIVEFEKVPYKGGAPFISRIKTILEKEDLKLKYNDSVTSFKGIIKDYSFTFEPETQNDLLLQLTKRKIPSKNAATLANSINQFANDKKNTEFMKKHLHILDAIKIYCRRLSGEEINNNLGDKITIKPSDDLSEILSKAKPGAVILLSKGVYTANGLQVNSSNITISGEPGAVIKGKNLTIKGSQVKLLNLTFEDVLINIGMTKDIELSDIIVKGNILSVNRSSKISIKNSLFSGVEVMDSSEVNFTHCTLLSGTQLNSAVKLKADSVEITDSIVYGKQFGIVILNDDTRKKYIVEKSLVFGEKGLCARKDGDKAIDKKAIATKLSHMRKYLTAKSNIYEPPQFVNRLKGDYRLVKKVPGYKDASDRKDCGVIWDSE